MIRERESERDRVSFPLGTNTSKQAELRVSGTVNKHFANAVK
jgi:hypothetical protein